MRFLLISAPALVAAGVLILPLAAQDKDKIERGRYLVEDVGKCPDCHSPRGDDGQLDKTKWLKGAVLDVQPIKEIKGWHKTAPDITTEGRTWQRWGEEAVVKYLMTGLGPRGTPADAPMPAYKFKKEDAEAVAAFLKTLKSQ